MGENVFSCFQTLLVPEITEKSAQKQEKWQKVSGSAGENVFSYFQTLLGLEITEKELEGWKVDRRKGVYKREKWQKVSRNGRKRFLPFIDTFSIQGILLFLLFLDTFSLISRPKSVQKWENIDFVSFFSFLDTFCCFSCFQTPFLLFQTQKCL